MRPLRIDDMRILAAGLPLHAARVCAFLAISLLAANVGCDVSAQQAVPACNAEAVLARMNDVVFGWKDVRQVQGQVRVGGGTQSDRDAFVDVLWQELARQRQGLPGGAETYKSRRLIVRQYRNGRNGDPNDKPAFDRDRIPEEAILTACGDTLLNAPPGERLQLADRPR